MYRAHFRREGTQHLTAPLDSELSMSDVTKKLQGWESIPNAPQHRDVIPFTVIRTDGEQQFPMTVQQQLDAIDSYLDSDESRWHTVSVSVDGGKVYNLRFDMHTLTEDDAIILVEEEMEGETLRRLVDKCRGGIWCQRSFTISIEDFFGDEDDEDEGDAAWYLKEFFGEES